MYLKLCMQMENGAGVSSVCFGDFLPACEKLRQSINSIYDINMQAVVRKSQLVSRTPPVIASRKLDQLDSVISLNELRIPPGNHLEALTRERKGQHSIRINDRYRVCFKWTEAGPIDVEITDYH